MQPIFSAMDWIVAHCEGWSCSCSNTMRTARSRTSGEYFFVLFMTPSSQRLESPANPGRFNFACVEIHPQTKTLLVYVKVDPDSVELKKGFTRDVRGIGHYGTGDLEIIIRSDEDFERAKALLLRS